MHSLLRHTAMWILLACLAAASTADEPDGATFILAPREGKSETIELFNGKDLTGWIGHEDLWSVEDGTIVGRHTKPLKVSTYLLTERSFSDFRLVTTALVKSNYHSGIAFWGKPAPKRGDRYTYAGHLFFFPGEWGLYDLYGRGNFNVDDTAARAAGKKDDWNEVELLAIGNRVRVAVNGQPVIDWRDPSDKALYEGPIGLQLHANKLPQEARYRRVVVTTFPEDRLITVKP